MRAPSYNSIVWTAVVAAVFSAIVATGLMVSFFGRQAPLPLDEPDYVALKQRLENDPDNRQLQEHLRALDVRLRQQHFERLRFAHRGAYLLLAGVATTLGLAHWASTVRRRLPRPKTAMELSDVETRQNPWGQVAAVALIVLVAAIVLASEPAARSLLPENLADLERQPPLHERDRPPQPIAPDTGPSAEQVARNWPRFRGPHGAGVSAFTDVPDTWDGTTGAGVLWKTAIELPGVSSPVVWEQHVFLTGATFERREVYCLDANQGTLLWRQSVAEDATAREKFHVEKTTGYAAPTPATDGQRVYVMFASGDLAAFDFAGHQVWSRAFGVLKNPYGHASSLTTYEQTLIMQLDQGLARDRLSKLLAIDGATGQILWQVQREVPASWSTPLVVEYQGEPRVITSSDPWVIAYAVEDGREIWRAECLSGDVGPSPVYADGVVYVANDYSLASAIRDGGQGDVTETHILWSASVGMPDVCSPLATDKYLLLITSAGTLIAYDRQRGGDEPVWEEDLSAMLFASPSLVGDRVYLIGDDGRGSVVRPTDTGLERLATNQLGERCLASPAFQPGRIYLRGEQNLYCIAAEDVSAVASAFSAPLRELFFFPQRR